MTDSQNLSFHPIFTSLFAQQIWVGKSGRAKNTSRGMVYLEEIYIFFKLQKKIYGQA